MWGRKKIRREISILFATLCAVLVCLLSKVRAFLPTGNAKLMILKATERAGKWHILCYPKHNTIADKRVHKAHQLQRALFVNIKTYSRRFSRIAAACGKYQQ